jgi:phosphoenolpyruvate synthase/pyruvate phosphate dikinase
MDKSVETASARESPSSKREPWRSASTGETEQMVVTIDATTGAVFKVEKIDKAGSRKELSEDECAKLAGEDEVDEIEAALEEAFEAGIAGALSEDEEDDLDDEEQALRRLLIGGLLRRRPVLGRLRARSVRRLLLRRLIRRRLLQNQLRR